MADPAQTHPASSRHPNRSWRMRRFLSLLSLGLLGLAAFTAYKAAVTPWAPRIDWDLLGVLWLLENLPKLAGWLFAFFVGGMGLMSYRAARRLPGTPADVASEDRRLLGYMLVNPIRRRTGTGNRASE